MLNLKRIAILVTSAWIFTLMMVQGADAEVLSSRLAGSDRYQTAIAASQSGWPTGSKAVVVTTGENYPDALSAAPLAGKYDAPLLLVPRSGLSTDILNELKRLSPKNAYIVGGNGVISASVEKQISSMGISVRRYSGQDRYDTAQAVAREVGTGQGVFVTSGTGFADALAVAPIATSKGMPILLVPKDELTPSLKKYVGRMKNVDIVIVGSEREVSRAIEAQLPVATRIGGVDAYARNIALLQFYKDSINQTKIYFATGESYPDALGAAALAKQGHNPLILLKGKQIPNAAQNYLRSKVINQMIIFGGEGIIPASTINQLAALPAEIAEVKNIRVNVKEQQTYNLPKTVAVKTSRGNLEEVPVTWNLGNVSTQRAGTYYYSGQIEGYYTTVELELIVEPLLGKADTFTAEVIQGSHYSLPNSVVVTLSDQSIKQYPVIWSSSPTVSMLNKIGTYTFTGTVGDTNLKTTLTLKVSEDTAITIKDSNFLWALKYLLDKPYSTQPIYRSDVLSITHLDVKECGISDLTGLEMFTNLKSVDLRNNYLESSALAPLQQLKNLKYLDLSFNNLESITSLSNLTSLTYLDLGYNNIKDYAPIKGMTRLTRLFLEGNASEDYSPIRGYYDQLIDKDFFLDSVDYQN
ncbi:cell wall-binding repeat-containing protein [Desulfitobacterium sp. THU1]|uniref:cell wall-binding repeat-containing protein n=1 Tax=Desulfitobacterium sp. THU1 TaxID=3138072 RepID=UPI00311E3E9A